MSALLSRRAAVLVTLGLVLVAGEARASQSALDPLGQLSGAIQHLAERVAPSVVQILTTGYGPVEGADSAADVVVGTQHGLASGVVIAPGGYIATNAHVVSGARRVQVVLPSAEASATPIQSLAATRERTVEAQVVGIAPDLDLAVIKIDVEGLPPLPFANYDALRQGELVFAFGSPEGLRNSLTMGIVSSVARQPDPDRPMVFIQTDAPINHGNSGGPLVNVKGELVGLNTFILSASGGSQGLGFAIPSTVVDVASRQLREYGHLRRGQIGANLQTITPDLARGLGLPQDWGVVVSDLMPGGPAAAAGLRVQDVVESVDGHAVESLPLLAFALNTKNPGDVVTLGVRRADRRETFQVRLIEVAADDPGLADRIDPETNRVPRLGILGLTLDDSTRDALPPTRLATGVVVAARTADPRSSSVPLVMGDVIHAVNGLPVHSVVELKAVLGGLSPDEPVVLQIERGGILRYLSTAGR
jgi:serine protease Do